MRNRVKTCSEDIVELMPETDSDVPDELLLAHNYLRDIFCPPLGISTKQFTQRILEN